MYVIYGLHPHFLLFCIEELVFCFPRAYQCFLFWLLAHGSSYYIRSFVLKWGLTREICDAAEGRLISTPFMEGRACFFHWAILICLDYGGTSAGSAFWGFKTFLLQLPGLCSGWLMVFWDLERGEYQPLYVLYTREIWMPSSESRLKNTLWVTAHWLTGSKRDTALPSCPHTTFCPSG